jgi:hypothetical protein
MSQFIVQGSPGPTTSVSSTDSAQNFSTSLIKNGNFYADGILITCETNSIRFALGGAVPTQAGLGHILASGGSIRLTGKAQISSFQFISQSSGQAATLQVTPEWL